MDIMSFFWLFFMIIALEPVLRKKLLLASRQKLIKQIEKERNSRLILLVHRQETMSILGFPLMRFIDINDAEDVLRAIHMTDPDVPLDIVLHTPGGLVLASLQIARAIKHHKGKVTVFVPHYAMSGGTLIALAADEIVMCRHSVLGPVDPQIKNFPAASIIEAVNQKSSEHIDDETLILADISRKAISQVKECVMELLSGTVPDDKIEKLATILSEGRWTHDHPLTYETVKTMGLPVSDTMPEKILMMMALFPQPVRQEPTVEYLPVPKRSKTS